MNRPPDCAHRANLNRALLKAGGWQAGWYCAVYAGARILQVFGPAPTLEQAASLVPAAFLASALSWLGWAFLRHYGPGAAIDDDPRRVSARRGGL